MYDAALEPRSLIRRLEMLEKQNRRMRAFGLALLIALGALLFMAQANRPHAIETEKLVLKDRKGMTRAILDADAEGTRFAIYDALGNARLGATTTGDSTEFIVGGPNGKPQFAIDAAKTGPDVMLFDLTGKDQIDIGAAKDGPTIQLNHANGKAGVFLALTKDEPGLTFLDANDVHRMFLDGDGIDLSDSKGTPRAALQLVQGAPAFHLNDPAGKLRLSMAVGLKDAPDASGLTVWDKNGRGHASLDGSGTGVSLTLADTQGFEARIGSSDLVTTRTGESHRTSAASMILFGSDKTVIWKAP